MCDVFFSYDARNLHLVYSHNKQKNESEEMHLPRLPGPLPIPLVDNQK